jgi:DNA mismatch repair protein MutS2
MARHACTDDEDGPVSANSHWLDEDPSLQRLSMSVQPLLSLDASLAELRVSPRSLKDLGFDDVIGALRGLCKTPFGRDAISDDIFTADCAELRARLHAAMEGKAAAMRLVSPDFGGLREVRHILEASGKGVVLAALDIVDVARTIDALGRLKDVIEAQGDDAPTLVALADLFADERRFSRRVLRSFDDSGVLVDDASPELSSRRARVRALRAEAQEKLQALVRDHDELGVLQDRTFTIRNDRYVLPVKSEFQGKVDGIVHDASQTHHTVFIEPRVLMALGNRITIARAEVVEEEQRILRDMSEEIAEFQERLAKDLRVAGVIEAAFARGRWAAAIDAEAVEVDPRATTLSLQQARHPLLAWLAAQAAQTAHGGATRTTIVPNELRLDGARCLVISGPNAGGKTVALKTAGLIALLARAGIPVPVAPSSVVPAFAGIHVSIGDEQTIEGGFSSFSGHLMAIKGIVDDVETDATRGPVLVLLDELMSGTDPAQGSALAQAVLEDLVADRGGGAVSVIVTTHADRLKALAIAEREHQGPRRFRNASVGTDRAGRPTFVLRLDEVGTSNALEAARRFGLKEATIERAVALLDPEHKEIHALLRSLAEQREQLIAHVDEARREQERHRQESARLERTVVELDAERARLRREGKRAFLDELKEARQVVKEAIAHSQSKDAKVINHAAATLKKLEDDTHRSLAERVALENSSLAPARVKVGDTVEVASMPGVRLVVEAVDGDDVTLARGPLRTRAARSTLRIPKEGPKEPSKDARGERSDKGSERGRGRSSSSVPSGAPVTAGPEPRTSDNSLDLRGQRADEALELLEAFLDKLLRSQHHTGHVLHGHGGGSLKKAVREYLRRSRYVRAQTAGGEHDGGDAWTIIELNPDARL